MLNKINNKILPLITVGFPGGYKFLIVLVVTSLASAAIATDFSKMFFWVALLVTFSGLPVASLMVSPQFILTIKHKGILILLSSIIAFIVAYSIELHQYSYIDNLFIYLSALCLSIYEILKRDFLNNADFNSLFMASCLSLMIVFTLLLVLYIFKTSSAELILIATFIALMLPLLYLHIIKKPAPIANQSSFSDIAAGFVKYTLSNATSTSLLFALPLVLLAEMGDVIAADLAQVFYFTSLTYLIPHALSAKHIPNMRQYGIVPGDVTSFFLSIFIFVVFTSLLALPLIQHFYTQWIVYLMLFIAMQISQLSLPFSNVLMVKGQANKILKVNIVASTVLVILITLIMFNVTAGDNRAKLLLLSFIGFQLLKLLLNYSSAKEYIRVTH